MITKESSGPGQAAAITVAAAGRSRRYKQRQHVVQPVTLMGWSTGRVWSTTILTGSRRCRAAWVTSTRACNPGETKKVT
jgi:hypothetical protein